MHIQVHCYKVYTYNYVYIYIYMYMHTYQRVCMCLLSQYWKPDLSSGRTNTSAGHPKRHPFCKSRTTWRWIRIRHTHDFNHLNPYLREWTWLNHVESSICQRFWRELVGARLMIHGHIHTRRIRPKMDGKRQNHDPNMAWSKPTARSAMAIGVLVHTKSLTVAPPIGTRGVSSRVHWHQLVGSFM